MASLRVLMFLCLAVAMVMCAEPERVKKDVVVGAYPYAYSAYGSHAYVPTAYTAGAYPYAGYAGYSAYPYSGYPYSGYPAYRSIVY